MSLEVRRDLDAGTFASAARRFLLQDEAAHGLMLAVLDGIERGRWRDAERTLVQDGAATVAVALRTPPQDLLLSKTANDDPAAVATVADAYLRDGPHLAGALAPAPIAEAFAARWTEATGDLAEVRMRMRIHRLDAVADLPAADGRMRLARPGDRATLVRWTDAFIEEAHARGPDGADVIVDRYLTDGTLRIWEVDGRAVSMAAAVGRTPSGIRITSVYTPPSERGQGYATTLVAELSRAQLAAGRRFCMLYTDAANPTSNAIYRRIGYVPIGDETHLRFVPVDA